MNTKIVTLALALVVLAGCGGSDGAAEPEATKTPAPRSYTIEELTAALPDTDDVADGSRIASTCPKDKDRCFEPEEGEQASVDIALLPAGESLADIEQSANESIFGNSVTVSVWRHASVSEAEKAFAKAEARDAKFDGPYDLEQKGDIKTGATPGEKGEGEVESLELDGWNGYFLDRRGTMVIDDESEARLIATAEVRQGSSVISVFVNVQSEGRSGDYAVKLARKSLDDYLERLG